MASDELVFRHEVTVRPGVANYTRMNDRVVQLETAPHAHVLVYVIRGELSIDCAGHEDGVIVGPQHATVIDPSVAPCVFRRSENDVEYYSLEFEMAAGTRSAIATAFAHHDALKICNPEGFVDIFRQYIRELHSAGDVAMIRECLAAVLLEAVVQPTDLSSDIVEQTTSAEVIATRVDAFIASHFPQPIDTAAVAARLRYNPDYLERTYNRIRGISVGGAIQQRRIHEACALLLDPNMFTVAEVAKLCGYAERARFIRAFKRVMGKTPSAFREAADAANALRTEGVVHGSH